MTSGSEKKDIGLQTEYLTVGNEYIVLCVYFTNHGLLEYQIEGDAGNLVILEADQFEVLSNYIPSNWELITTSYADGSYYLNLAPKKWNEAIFDVGDGIVEGFYEQIVDQSGPLEGWRNYPDMPEEMDYSIKHYTPEVVQLYFQEKDIIYQEEEAYRLKQDEQ